MHPKIFLLLLLSVSPLAEAQIPCPEVASGPKLLREDRAGWFYNNLSLTDDFDTGLGVQLEQVHRLLEQAHLQVVVVPVPWASTFHFLPENTGQPDYAGFDPNQAAQSYQRLVKMFEQRGFLTVNLLQAFQQQEQPMYFQTDHHWTPAGSEKAAMAVRELLQARAPEVLKSLHRFNVRVEPTGTHPFTGSFIKARNTACKNLPADSRVEQIFKRIAVTRDQEETLLGGEPPLVVVVGSSFARSNLENTSDLPGYGFEQFLSRELGTGVRNEWVSGGTSSSFLGFLKKTDPDAMQAQLIVWEFPVTDFSANRHDINLIFFRQLAAGLMFRNDPGQQVFSEQQASAGTKEQKVSFEPLKHNATYLRLRFSDPAVNRFQLNLQYASSSEQLNVVQEGSGFYSDGTYTILLASKHRTLKAVHVQWNGDKKGWVQLDLYQR